MAFLYVLLALYCIGVVITFGLTMCIVTCNTSSRAFVGLALGIAWPYLVARLAMNRLVEKAFE